MRPINYSNLDSNASALAAIAKKLLNRKFERESLILRLVVAGLPLKDAVSLEANDAANCAALGREFDPYCRLLGMRDLIPEIMVHVKRCVLGRNYASDYSVPLFPSRKRGNPISPRTAERLFNAALKLVDSEIVVTFRHAGLVGRGLRRAQSELHCQERDDLLVVLPKIRSEAAMLFPNHSHDREDAEQTAFIEMLEQSRGQELPRAQASQLAGTAIHRFRRRHLEYRRTEVTGLLGDWATVNNRFNAKSRFRVDTSEVECATNDKDAHAHLKELLKTLPKRDRQILEMTTGFGDGRSYVRTRAEIAALFNITPERVRQIESRAIRKLQEPSRACIVVGLLD